MRFSNPEANAVRSGQRGGIGFNAQSVRIGLQDTEDFRRLNGVGNAKIVPAQGIEIHLNPYTPL